MSLDVDRDHQRFCRITEKFVERSLACYPNDLTEGREWIVACYQSCEVFAKRFCNPEERDELLDNLAEEHAAVVEAFCVHFPTSTVAMESHPSDQPF